MSASRLTPPEAPARELRMKPAPPDFGAPIPYTPWGIGALDLDLIEP